MDRCNICKQQDGCVCVPYGCECFEIDLSKHDAQVRAEVISEISREMRLLYGNEYEKQIRADVIEEIIEKCSKEYQAIANDTVCKIWLSDLEILKEKQNG